MTRRLVMLVTALFAASNCSAALYEFTLEGTVTVTGRPFAAYVNVGDPFTVRFIADDTDMTPGPIGATYAAGNTFIEFPNASYVSAEPGLTQLLYVTIWDTGQGILYRDSVMGPDNIDWPALVQLLFPPGVLPDGSLPLTVPLQSATLARLEMYVLNPKLYGNVTSYTSRQIPEPVLPLVVMAHFSFRLRHASARSASQV